MEKIPKDVIIILTKEKRSWITNENITEKLGKNANKVIREAINLKTMYKILKFRKCGKIEIYIK